MHTRLSVLSMINKPFIKVGAYQHYKGNLYQVIGIAKHSETLDPMVVYCAQTDEHNIWVRPYEMFKEIVEVDGEKVPRFKYLHS